MKITKIKLVNFASIYSAMELSELSINFKKKCRNKICLIVGKNGSGKTSLLSNMHPFPHLGTLDVRNGQDLIRDGMDGLKEISFEDNKENVYDISHHYLYKKDSSRKVMSYIALNGEELNPSGSVTKFYEIIESEFGITPAFLKIIRLGPNVADLIDNTTQERKEFFSKLLSQVDVYNEFYKRAMEESRSIKANMKMIVSKMDKLLGVPIDVAKDNLVHKANQLKDMETSKNKLIADYNYYLGTVDPRYKNSTESITTELTKCQTEVSSIKDKLNAIEVISANTVSALDYVRKESVEQVKQLTVDKEVLQTHLTYISQNIADNSNELYDYQNKLQLIKESSEIKDMQTQLSKLKKDVKNTKVNNLPYTKEDALYEANLLQQLDSIMKELLEYPIQCIPLIKDMVVDSLYPLTSMKETIDRHQIELAQKMSLGVKKHKNVVRVFIIPKKCTQYKKCMYYQAIENSLDTQEHTMPVEYEQELYEACANILNIFQVINNIIKTKQKNPLRIQYNIGQFINAYLNSNKQNILDYIDRTIITNALDDCEDQINLEKNQTLISKLEIELRARKAELSNDSESEITKHIQACEEKKTSLEAEMYLKKQKLTQINSDLEKANNDVTKLERQISELQKKTEYEQELSVWEEKFNDAESLLQAKTEVGKKEIEFNNVLRSTNSAIQDMAKDIQNLNYFIIEYESLNKEKDVLANSFNSVELVRDAVSPGKGIPLIFIQLYLKSIQIAANNIIHDMFGNGISLNDFIVTEKEFTIPYVINGVNVSDVSMSCQGERAIITLALSFAILEQFTTKYNVLLLDEVDGPLYKENREKFFFILERQMKTLGANQVFIISHNNLFENYPVDVICTSEDADVQSGLKNINLIWQR